MQRTSFFPLLAALLLPFAGCVGDSLAADASIDYDGSETGSHSDNASCDDEGSLDGSGTIHDGSLTVRVTDPDGSELFEQSFTGAINVNNAVLKGDSGSWKIEASRNGNDPLSPEFHGDYEFDLVC